MNLSNHSKDALKVINHSVNTALEEDIGTGDVTAASFNNHEIASAKVISREEAVLCGQKWFELAFHKLDPNITIDWQVNDGESLTKDSTVCTLSGSAQAILTGERTALNFLQTLSGTATKTKTYVDRISGTNAQILDTRKTLPGMRYAQKYAVRCGGGTNHRMGLFDAILIKENHIATAGSVSKAVNEAKQQHPSIKLEVEVENVSQLKEALKTKTDVILLDNFSLSELENAVAFTDGKKKLEASGNMTLENIREVAKTGVNFISIGAITKHVQAVDFSMRFKSE
ncbi:MAG: carboxylating nicotinate-nucleotide diphosphorylase [Gammaproteobacteria bacterium]